MSKIEEFAQRWRDKYYYVDMQCREVKPNFWIVRVEVKRIDSNEVVGGSQRSGESRESAFKLIIENFDKNFSLLPRPPPEWERMDLRSLLIDYKVFSDKLTAFLVQLEKLRRSGSLSESDLHRSYWGSRDLLIDYTKVFSRKLNEISEVDRIALMTSYDDAYKNRTDPWNLEDLQRRSDLFRFIENPSQEVVRAHEIHDARRGGE
ncbi:hypothetical protein [Massilia sp. CCM 8734]|uniref:hypothetical protein n=1 Tax=Massilia sp. CCM 8734 TaxID=2609283 RepID=UPI00141F72FD|nr:hypothetical protein [Massilia sp. CCM 8734]NHZ98589.1 hypothetical protein [Massilia sp. CCM 8734]